MRYRGTAAISLIVFGVLLLAFAAILVMSHAPTLNWIIFAAVGLILIVIGVGILVMDLMEKWLSRGQRALVNGLQAG